MGLVYLPTFCDSCKWIGYVFAVHLLELETAFRVFVVGRIAVPNSFLSQQLCPQVRLDVPDRKIGSMDYFTYLYMGYNYWGYNPLILILDPKFLGHPSSLYIFQRTMGWRIRVFRNACCITWIFVFADSTMGFINMNNYIPFGIFFWFTCSKHLKQAKIQDERFHETILRRWDRIPLVEIWDGKLSQVIERIKWTSSYDWMYVLLNYCSGWLVFLFKRDL